MWLVFLNTTAKKLASILLLDISTAFCIKWGKTHTSYSDTKYDVTVDFFHSFSSGTALPPKQKAFMGNGVYLSLLNWHLRKEKDCRFYPTVRPNFARFVVIPRCHNRKQVNKHAICPEDSSCENSYRLCSSMKKNETSTLIPTLPLAQ